MRHLEALLGVLDAHEGLGEAAHAAAQLSHVPVDALRGFQQRRHLFVVFRAEALHRVSVGVDEEAAELLQRPAKALALVRVDVVQ